MTKLIALLLLAAGCAVEGAPVVPAEPAVLQLEAIDDGKWYGCGAVAIAPRVVATAAHCVRGVVTLTTATGARMATETLFYDYSYAEGRDLALLEVNVDLPFAYTREAVAGEPVHAVRTQTQGFGDLATGTIVGLAGPWFSSDLPSALGDSGSALFGADGSVVGIIARCVPKADGTCNGELLFASSF